MAQDRMQRQRFEFKYVVDEPTALGLRAFAGSCLEPDEASAGKPDLSYRVNSLYLDSDPLYTYWDWINANRNRFKLRVRFYDASPDTPAYLEIKRRVCGCIQKQRCAVRKADVAAILAGQLPAPHPSMSRDAKHCAALEAFGALAARIGARPKALVTYMREAYVHPENDNVRVTLDRQVRIALCPRPCFDLDLRPFVQPFGDQVILELKFTNTFPDWFGQMVRAFGLTRSAAAKYCEGMASLIHPQHAGRPAWLVNAPLVEPDPAPATQPARGVRDSAAAVAPEPVMAV